ncbi:hypothetical protein AB0I81_04385 [Nonomuraea sp. NPDC050404]|uniref:hypothetical protein n=1 Tax=Nonomuraea sp. NPDC050404 TaxID=3155783 RepID=UPI0033F5794B
MLHREMLDRPVDERRYQGVVRPDKTVRWAVEQLALVEEKRRAGPSHLAALPGPLRELAELLTELGWDDLAALARREELRAYRKLDEPKPGAFAGRMVETMVALRRNLVEDGRYEEALAVADEQLAIDRHRSGQEETREWRTVLLTRLGRHEEALESAGAAVAELRAGLERAGLERAGRKSAGGAAAGLKLCHALTAFAERLDRVGRVAEAADATAEVLAFWRGQDDSRYQVARSLDELSDRLVRSGRGEEAYEVIVEVWPQLRRDDGYGELAEIWHNLAVRLLPLSHPRKALAAGSEAVRRHRARVHGAREQHRAVEERDDWDDDHRYAEWYLRERRRAELEESQERVRQAEQALREALRTLAACLRRLDRTDAAAAVEAEAASGSSSSAQ